MTLGELVDEVHVAVLGRDVDGCVADLREQSYYAVFSSLFDDELEFLVA